MTEQTNTSNASEASFNTHRIYTKDISLEAPNTPAIFQAEWKPEINVEMDTSSSSVADNVYEVCLRLTITAKIGEEIAYICEVKQAGIFSVNGLDENQLPHFLAAYCPNILFPYARECVDNLLNRATFPTLHLAPINFDALYMNRIQQQAEQSQQQDA